MTCLHCSLPIRAHPFVLGADEGGPKAEYYLIDANEARHYTDKIKITPTLMFCSQRCATQFIATAVENLIYEIEKEEK